MHRSDDFEDRVAARLLGVDVDADPTVIRGQFRRLARAVHPDVSVEQGCADLGRLAEAKDRLIVRANARLRAAQRREDEARRRVEAMRAAPVTETLSGDGGGFVPLTDARTRARVVRLQRPVRSEDRLGRLVDLAG